jgi:subtilisin family serine protease
MKNPRSFIANPRLSNRLRTFFTCVAVSALAFAAGSYASEENAGVSAQVDTPPSLKDSVQVMVEMLDAPATVVYAKAFKAAQIQADAERAKALAHPNAPGAQAILKKKVQISQAAANEVKGHVQQLKQTQEAILPSLTGDEIGGRVLYKVQRAYNGVALAVSPSKISAIAQLPGVKAVHPLHPKYPSATFSDIDFLRARAASGGPWSTGNVHGEGIKIADIDSGLDYVHSNFGGNGDYTGVTDANPNGHFPSAKVPGGFDFVGDAYNADDPAHSTPHQDANPFDGDPSGNTAGHGTGTASLIAGVGENNNGTPYTGAYDATNPDISTLKIAPGFAPKALLYPLRVFGSSGSSNVITEAIEWAMDPNGDNDMSDHMDVINMSLGSNEGYPDDPDAVAASNAASIGVIVCAAAGNAGDSYYIHSSPAAASGVISVAASFNDQSGYIADSKVTGNSPAAIAGVAFHSIYGSPSAHVSGGGLTGDVIYGVPNDGNPEQGAGPYTPLSNAAQISGKICLIDRGGGIGFATKCGRAQASGAIAVIVDNFNNPGADPIIMALNSSITIPCVMISRTDRDAINAAAGGFNATTGVPTNTVNVTINNDNAVITHGGAAPDTMPTYSSRGPALPDSGLKPDVTAPAEVVGVATNRSGQAVQNFNGTSSATPHVSGTMALLRQLHPTWTVQELNALLCETATNDLFTTNAHTTQFGVGRVGAGRIDLTNAATAGVVAYNGSDPDLIGVSFGVVETPVSGVTTLTKNITVTNKGATDVTYNLSIQNNPALAGASFTLPGGNSLTVNAGTSATVQVQFTATGSALKHRKESSVSFQLPGPNGRQWLTEAAGYVKFTPTDSSPTLRVGVYAAPKPISAMHTTATTFAVKNGSTGTISLPLAGTPVNTGANYGFGFDIISLVKPFELQYAGTGPSTDPNVIKYVGVMSDYAAVGNKASNTVITFAIEGFGNAAVPEFNSSDKEIYIDTNHDGTLDFAIFLSSLPNGTAHSNSYAPVLVNLKTGTATQLAFPFETNLLDPVFNPDGNVGGKDTNSFNNSAILVQIPANMLLPGTSQGGGAPTKFDYLVATFDRNGSEVMETPLMSYDVANPGFGLAGGHAEPFYYNDLPTTNIPVQYAAKNFKANGTLGVLLVHRHNATGSRSDVVPFTISK